MLRFRSSIGLILMIQACLQSTAWSADLETGEEINEVCAGCHGENGQGGNEGEYPRIAGMPAAFIEKQLYLFQDRKRPNLPMVEHVEKRQMPASDVVDVSAWLARIELPTRLPSVDENAPDFDAYQRLLDAERVMQIPRAEGSIEAGGKLYNKECRSCHGGHGLGKREKAVPMLAGQYTRYLWRQVDKYLQGIRIHDEDEPDDELLAEFSREEIRDIFAWLSVQDD